MWARVIEIMLAGWLAISPFVIHGQAANVGDWNVELVCAGAVVLFALLSFYHRMRRAYLLTIIVGACLTASTLLTAAVPATPAAMNAVAVGLLLMMLGVIPSNASIPPRRWREYLERKSRE